ncbi:MAG: hypothetical protein CMN76_05785 [Spirochaetaceae bacterium]|nr:hypothetical protein [Spirochaetaceae bacterium]|tara:strand:+ start:187217 stop:187825 length:609 start_codon:yes stop_codon:yes gene_type:complete
MRIVNPKIKPWHPIAVSLVLALGLWHCQSAGQTSVDANGRDSSEEQAGMDSNSSSEGSNEAPSSPDSRQDDGRERGVEVVERPGLYVYHYPETLQLEDPYDNYLSKRRVYDNSLNAEIRELLKEEEAYSPEYTARCLPVYDYGIVIVEENSRSTYLFSFRCNTMHYREKKLWKDFTPIRNRLYTLLQYQVNDNTSVIVDSRK